MKEAVRGGGDRVGSLSLSRSFLHRIILFIFTALISTVAAERNVESCPTHLPRLHFWVQVRHSLFRLWQPNMWTPESEWAGLHVRFTCFWWIRRTLNPRLWTGAHPPSSQAETPREYWKFTIGRLCWRCMFLLNWRTANEIPQMHLRWWFNHSIVGMMKPFLSQTKVGMFLSEFK